ncbi:MAG TPA: hypothetical protein VNO86_05525 [Candidatus Binatia bacterium]|nr:hypothetical protein [Candidatus Binatia bacterium]
MPTGTGDETWGGQTIHRGPSGADSSACDEAFKAAASVDEMQDTVADLYPAVRACSLEQWDQAWERYGDDLGFAGTSREVLGNICLAPEVADEALCQALN